jgi:hypothetical protein
MALRDMTTAWTHRSQRPHKYGGLFARAGQLAAGLFLALGLLAVLWTGSLVSAVAAERSPTPAPVRYYIVPRSGHGPATLIDIAQQTLGSGSRFMQIFTLNKGRLQPNGRRLENPEIIEPGWVLELPSDARGPGVRFGPLPLPAPSASAAPSSPSGSPPSAGSSSSPAVLVTTLAVVIAGGLAVMCIRLFRPRSRRRRHATVVRSRGRQHVRLHRPRPSEEVSAPHATGPVSWSWPPSMVTSEDLPADHPSRPQRAVDERGWPADHPSRPQRAVDGQGRPYAAGREPGIGAWSGQPVPATPAGLPQPPPNWRGPTHAPSRSPSFPPLPVREYERPAEPRAFGQSTEPRGYGRPAEPRAQEAGAVPREQDLRPFDALRVVNMLLSEAEAEAGKIRAEADAFRAEATAQAATLREAAEREAAKVRASLHAMSADLNQVATFVTQRLTIPDEAEREAGADADRSESRPRTMPAAATQTRAKSRSGASRLASAPAARAATKPDTAPATAPAATPGERPRQLRAARVTVAAIAGLLLFGAASGTAEIILHGMPFFVFRSAGTGGTPGSGLKEDQGPGQPNAPGAHHHTAPRHQQKAHHHRPARHHAGGSTH